ncbi:asparagine synthase-related protein [Salinarimonas soli]|uniref:asparagine synthase (glutamine-hydrolyzing) n=1 Tax=Salinarimonas soli TaxID=1638099 RepID=A0A5B2V8K6_9HYPH|nr:asparagine synthase-related protein [Salinarimonas soli]KAA2234772.1 hypothetical protein F0L46_22750 [Salinarimonas soli]
MVGIYGSICATAENRLTGARRMAEKLTHDGSNENITFAGRNWSCGVVAPKHGSRVIKCRGKGVAVIFGVPVLRGEALLNFEDSIKLLADDLENSISDIQRHLKNFDGCFALAVIDPSEEKLLLVSDPSGGVPIYYNEPNLTWASEPKALSTLDAVSPARLKDFVNHGYVRPPETYFHDVRQLPQRCAMIWDLNRLTVSTQQVYERSMRPLKVRADPAEACLEFSRLTTQAIRKRLVASGLDRVDVTLSGGLDSRLLAVEGNKNWPVRALSYGQRWSPELTLASNVANQLKVEHLVVHVEQSNWLVGRDKAIWMTDGMMDMMHTHIWHLSPLLRSDRAILDGLFGDVVLGRSRITLDPEADEHDNRLLRMSRFTFFGPRLEMNRSIVLTPLIDLDLIAFVDSLPEEMTSDGKLYRDACGTLYGAPFTEIAWHKTGRPPSPYERNGIAKAIQRTLKRTAQISGWFGTPLLSRHETMDYFRWMKREPFRTYFLQLMYGKSALLKEYIDVPPEQLLFTRLPAPNRVLQISRLLTLEAWLRQTQAGKFLTWEQMLDS